MKGSSRGRIPWGLAGMLALVLVLECVIARRGADVTTPWADDWRLAGDAARREAPRCDLLCFGDSLAKDAFLTRVVETRTGRRAYNLSVCASQAPASYFLLRRALESGARPSAIVVEYKPNLLAGGPEYLLRHWQEFLTPGEALELAAEARDPGFFALAILGRAVPSIRARHEIRDVVAAALRHEPSPWRTLTLQHRRHWTVNRGSNVAPRNPAFTGRVDEGQHRAFHSGFWKCHRVNRVFITRFLDLAASRSIPVFWLLPPLSPEIQERREETGVDGRHAAFVRSFLRLYPNLAVIDARRSAYAATLFVDPVHLDRDGASALSLDLADVIQATEPGSRWVMLPSYRDRPAVVELEDTDQSRVALERPASRRR